MTCISSSTRPRRQRSLFQGRRMPVRKHSKALKWDKEKTRELFLEYQKTKAPQLRDEIIQTYMNLVEYLARRFKNRGEPLEDLVQVGVIGIIKAIERFDVER